MKILLIGHSIIDHLEKEGKEVVKPGGIFYSVGGILSVKKAEDEIYLLTGINQNNYKLFERIFTRLNLDHSCYISDMPEVFLKVFENKEREEVYKNISSKLKLDKIEDWNKFDGILINMITGFDLSLEQITSIRKSFDGPIYFDVHTLSRGVDAKMNREFRPIPDSEKWLSNIDILQCNENELRTVVDLKEEDAAKKILEHGPKVVIVTKGGNGVTAYSESNSEIVNYNLNAEKVKVVNKIGCGDIFGSVFFYLYLCGENILESLKSANKIAGFSVSNNIVDNPEIMKDYVKQRVNKN